MMAAHAYKFAPGRSVSSMGSFTQRVPSAGSSTQSNKARFQVAVNAYKTATGATSADVAARLEMPHKAFDHAMSNDPQRAVSLSRVHAAEALAQSVKAAITDEEIVQAARELAIAKARWERIEHGLMEGAA